MCVIFVKAATACNNAIHWFPLWRLLMILSALSKGNFFQRGRTIYGYDSVHGRR